MRRERAPNSRRSPSQVRRESRGPSRKPFRCMSEPPRPVFPRDGAALPIRIERRCASWRAAAGVSVSLAARPGAMPCSRMRLNSPSATCRASRGRALIPVGYSPVDPTLPHAPGPFWKPVSDACGPQCVLLRAPGPCPVACLRHFPWPVRRYPLRLGYRAGVCPGCHVGPASAVSCRSSRQAHEPHRHFTCFGRGSVCPSRRRYDCYGLSPLAAGPPHVLPAMHEPATSFQLSAVGPCTFFSTSA